MNHRITLILMPALLLCMLLALSGSAKAQHIVIDPGHGGNDPGGTGTGMQEKEVVLDISSRFRDLLDADTSDTQGGGAWSVSMTRDTDVFIPLAARSDYANALGADRFMSIHANAFGNASANGTETFSYGAATVSANLRNLVQEEMIGAWGLTNRGNKTAGFSVLVNTAMPAELHELGFITNAADAIKLGSPTARQDAAIAHLRALQRHYNLAPYVPQSQTEPTTGSLMVTTHSELDVAIAGAGVHVDGEWLGESDENGVFSIDGLEIGEHLVAVLAAEYQARDQIVQITADDTASLFFELPLRSDGDGPDGEGGGGATNCDSAQPACQPPSAVSDGSMLGGGCSTHGGASGCGATLLLLAFIARLRRRSRVLRSRD